MRRKTRIVFNDVAKLDSQNLPDGLIYAIRTDADFATSFLKKNLLEHLNTTPKPEAPYQKALSADKNLSLESHVRTFTHGLYKIWGHDVLRAMAEGINYDTYNISDPGKQFLNTHFYDSHELSRDVVVKAKDLVKSDASIRADLPVIFVSLDSMLSGEGTHWSEIAFSRLFTVEGEQQPDYVARPGHDSIDVQIKLLAQKLKDLKHSYGANIPFVLLEDNIRHARMLNWAIQKMEDHNVFDHGKLAGISTCFCCAPDSERAAIQHRGITVPLAISVDYKDALVDVTTPRDLLFDGFVVEAGNEHVRLPGIFMDVVKRFKIAPDKAEDFNMQVRRANLEFCYNIESEFGVPVPLSWFSPTQAESHVTGCAPHTLMTKLMSETPKPKQPSLPAPKP